ncbi:hypothetical protein PR202_ga25977 [Eleusine coracana subsp. coracana]|uniref:Thiaminase-2/PQQC domain-containing protein n=1 Tax=Eleusine coracana subsp. coracana TaxID=191504 RepID=A0AAV5DCR5_ELECO|nr:hypothetical protein PR202_ga25977 [Eleusine coracana subsp. coracana]
MDGGGVEATTTAAWMEKHREMYERATRHPFTVSIRDGAVDLSAFKRWLDSFGFCIEEGNKTPPELLGTCQRWGSPEFKQYCESLQRIVDRCLANAPADAVKSAEEAFTRVLELEIGLVSEPERKVELLTVLERQKIFLQVESPLNQNVLS